MRGLLTVLLGGAMCAPAGTSAPPPQAPPPSALVRGDEGINGLAAEACGFPCAEPLPAYAQRVRPSRNGELFVDLDPTRCRVPGFRLTPQECVGTCSALGLLSFVADFGPIGPTTSLELCTAIERDRGAAQQGSCHEVCAEDGGCTWPATEARAAFKLVGYLEVACGVQDEDEDEPNQSFASNSMSP